MKMLQRMKDLKVDIETMQKKAHRITSSASRLEEEIKINWEVIMQCANILVQRGVHVESDLDIPLQLESLIATLEDALVKEPE